MKTALITGVTGQDGAYLCKTLLDKKYKVFGTYRRTSTPNFWRLQYLDVIDKINLIPADLADMSSLLEAVNVSKPDEIYNLAAQSYVGASFDQPLHTAEIDGMGAVRFLEIIRNQNPDIRFYQASTSELYGNTTKLSQDENTPFNPSSPYAIAKLYAFHTCKVYRKAYKLFVTNGILFNHESPLRGMEFVTRKITNAVARIKLDLQKELSLGNIEAKRDWGFAKEYVEAMWLMLQQDKSDDYVIATGETHSVREFAQVAFDAVNLNWEDHVKTDKKLLRPLDLHSLHGDITKAKTELEWEPKIKFAELVKIMVNSDLQRWEKALKGETFPWDAPNYPREKINIVKRTPNV